MIDVACKAAMADSLAEGEASQFSVMEKNVKERGVKQMIWSPQLLALFKEKWLEVVAELSQKDAFFDKAWKDLSHFRQGYKVWKKHGFLHD